MLLAMLPLGHNYNLASPGLLGAFYHGGTVVIAPSPDADTVFGLIAQERVTVVAAAVPLIAGWLHGDVADRHDLSSLKVVQNGVRACRRNCDVACAIASASRRRRSTARQRD